MSNHKKFEYGTAEEPFYASATHEMTDDGKAIVTLGPLIVYVTNDDGSFFAQSLQVDYAAQGTSLEDVMARFESGLCATITQHLTMFGSIKGILVPAPSEYWLEFVNGNGVQVAYSNKSIHELKINGIQYVELKAAA